MWLCILQMEYILHLTAYVVCIMCIHVASSLTKTCYKLVMSNFAVHEQLRCHQFPVHSWACNKYFYARPVYVQLHMRVFLKFKSSCTITKRKHFCLRTDLPNFLAMNSPNFHTTKVSLHMVF